MSELKRINMAQMFADDAAFVDESVYWADDVDAELSRLTEKVAELEALAEKRKTFVESQVRINTLLYEEKDTALAECERLNTEKCEDMAAYGALMDENKRLNEECERLRMDAARIKSDYESVVASMIELVNQSKG